MGIKKILKMSETVSKEFCDERFERINDSLQNHEKKIENLEKVYVLLERLTNNYENQAKTIESIDNRLTNIENEPANKWKQITSYVITAIIGAIVTYILVKIGLK